MTRGNTTTTGAAVLWIYTTSALRKSTRSHRRPTSHDRHADIDVDRLLTCSTPRRPHRAAALRLRRSAGLTSPVPSQVERADSGRCPVPATQTQPHCCPLPTSSAPPTPARPRRLLRRRLTLSSVLVVPQQGHHQDHWRYHRPARMSWSRWSRRQKPCRLKTCKNLCSRPSRRSTL